MKIPQKYCRIYENTVFFSRFIATHVYCTMGENTVFSSKVLFSRPKNTVKPFCKVGIPDGRSFLLKHSVCLFSWGWYGVVLDCFTPES